LHTRAIIWRRLCLWKPERHLSCAIWSDTIRKGTPDDSDRRSEKTPSLRVATPGTADREFRYIFEADDITDFVQAVKAAG
jgi:hypothetical protein